MKIPTLPALLFVLAPQHEEPSQSPAATHLPEEGVVVPMLDLGGRPLVELFVGDRDPIRVLVDTGSTHGLLASHETCVALGLVKVAGTDSGTADRVRYLAPEVRLGDALFEDLPVAEISFPLPGVDGVLGFPCFTDCLVTFDFGAHELRLASGSLEPGPNVVPFRRDEVLGFGLMMDVAVGDVTVPVHVDTGSPDVALFSTQLIDRFELANAPTVVGRARTPMGDAEIQGASLVGALRLGPIQLEAPAVRFGDFPQFAGRPIGNLGSGFFRSTSLTIDQRNGRARIDVARKASAQGH